MSLKSIVAKAAGVAFKVAGDLASDVVYRRLVDLDNPDYENDASWNDYNVKGVMSEVENGELIAMISGDNSFKSRRVITILAASLPFAPDTVDIVKINGKYGIINSVAQDSAGATWELEITLFTPVTDGR